VSKLSASFLKVNYSFFILSEPLINHVILFSFQLRIVIFI